MIVPIVLYGQPVLRQKAPNVPDVTAPEVRQLIDDLIDTMRAAHGLGLAAPQIGVSLQAAVVDVAEADDRPSRLWINGKSVELEDYMPLILLNPQVLGIKTKELGGEGCLSIPGVSAEVARSARVKVTTHTLEGKLFSFEADGLLARAIQHEVDHLNGKLFIDLLSKKEREELKEDLDAIRGSAWLPS